MLHNCKPGLPISGWSERSLQLTSSVSDMKGSGHRSITCVSRVLCRMCDMLMITQEMAQDDSLSKSSARVPAIVSAAVYIQCVIRWSPVLQQTTLSLSLSLSSSVHRSWSKIVQVGHLKSHYVCTDFSHGEISGGIQNLVALVCLFLSFFLSFFFFAFFLNCYYYCGSDVFTKTRQLFIIMVFLSLKAVMVTECWLFQTNVFSCQKRWYFDDDDDDEYFGSLLLITV